MTLHGRKLLKWTLWIILLFFLGGIQSSPAFPELFGMRPSLLLAAGICAVLLETKMEAACGYAILAGLIWDVVEGRLLGFYGLLMLLVCAGAGWLTENYLRVSLPNAAWMSGIGSICCGLVSAEFYLFIWGYAEGAVGTVLAGILARSVYTALVAPLIFWIMKKMQSRSMGLVESGLRLRASRMRSDRKE